IVHHPGDDGVAHLAAVIGHPREDHHLVVLGMDRTGKGRELAVGHVVADALDIGERAMLYPDRPGEVRQRLVVVKLLFRNGNQDTIDIWHGYLPTGNSNACPVRRADARSPQDEGARPAFRYRPAAAASWTATRAAGMAGPAVVLGQQQGYARPDRRTTAALPPTTIAGETISLH